eukprot:gene20669-26798_t
MLLNNKSRNPEEIFIKLNSKINLEDLNIRQALGALELTVDSFITNDTYISSEHNIAIITGPNSSGKSVYLKQVGVLVYLAHIGCYLPCEKAIIGLTDCIMTRVSCVESTVTPLSSFSIDLCQVNKMFSCATSKSLCLLDEFGKGTTPIDGVSLLAATLQKFVKMKVKVR